ncbi:MAG: Flp pilus assembly protein CpaB [Bacillota bacterium]|nr:Flp pilus assembly protein CpaB [Bacillota bacterium]
MKKVYILAAIAALITGALLYFYLQSLNAQTEVPTADIVIATTDIAPYTRISAEMLGVKTVEQGTQHPQSLTDPREAIGLVSSGMLVAGEALLSSKLKSIGESQDGLSLLVPDGMRAISVAVDGVSGIAGFLRQNDRVDVLVTIELPYTKDDGAEAFEMTTTLVAGNIRVLATGRDIADTLTEEGDPAGYELVTLLVTPQQAADVAFAMQEGRMTLVLRSVTDDQEKSVIDVDRKTMAEQRQTDI